MSLQRCPVYMVSVCWRSFGMHQSSITRKCYWDKMSSVLWVFVWLVLSQIGVTSSIDPRQSDEPDPQQQQRPDCATYSLSYPLFRVYDPIWVLVNRTAGGTLGDFWFTAHNMATNVQVECEIKNANLFPRLMGTGNSSWHYCKDNSTMFRMSLETNEFQLRENWVCDNLPGQVSHPVI